MADPTPIPAFAPVLRPLGATAVADEVAIVDVTMEPEDDMVEDVRPDVVEVRALFTIISPGDEIWLELWL